MRKLPVLKVGDIAAIEFFDHAASKGDEFVGCIPFEVIGRVVRVTENEYVFGWWNNIDGELDHNCEYIAIARPTIYKVKKLK